MADSPTGAALSDDEFLDLVDEVEAEGTPASTEDPEELSTDAVADEATDETDPDDLPASSGTGDEDEDEADVPQAGAPSAAAPAPTPPAGKPFQFKASGSTHELPGARELSDGSIVVPPAAKAALLQRLASQVELSSNFKTLQRDTSRQIAKLKADRTDKDIESDAVIKLMSDIVAMTPDERIEYFDRFDAEVPKLQLEVEKAKLARDREALKEERSPTPLPDEIKEQREVQLQSALGDTYKRVMAHPDMKLLNVEDVNRVFQKHAKRLDRLVTKDGENEVFDDTDVIEDLNLLLDIRKRQAPGTTARDKNAARNADRQTSTIPPVVRPNAPAAGARGKGQKSYAGKPADFRKDFLSGDLDTP